MNTHAGSWGRWESAEVCQPLGAACMRRALCYCVGTFVGAALVVVAPHGVVETSKECLAAPPGMYIESVLFPCPALLRVFLAQGGARLQAATTR